MLVSPSPIKIRLNEYPARIPATAGPIPAPRFTAIRISENERVILSPFANELIADDMAGRSISRSMLVMNIPAHKAPKPFNHAIQ